MMTFVEHEDVDLIQLDVPMIDRVQNHLHCRHKNLVLLQDTQPIFQLEVVDVVLAAKHCDIVGKNFRDESRLLLSQADSVHEEN